MDRMKLRQMAEGKMASPSKRRRTASDQRAKSAILEAETLMDYYKDLMK